MHVEKTEPNVYGLIAEFESPETLQEAVEKSFDAGYKKLDAYSPFPIVEIYERIGKERQAFNLLPMLVFFAGVTGFIAAYFLQYYTAAMDTPVLQLWRIIINGYPLNIGGRPFHSWPAFTVIIFETTVLFTAGAAVFGMFILNGLPMPYHPLFYNERFSERASTDKFFLCIEAIDPKFDINETKQFLEGLKPVGDLVEEVPASANPDKGVQWPEF